MKTEPTDIDREAARLFRIEVRMRAFTEFARGTVINADQMNDGTICVTLVGDGTYEALGRPIAIDTDDPATVGCMLAQVEAAAGPVVLIWDAWKDGMTHYVVRYLDKWSGPTRGAALVAAKRALAEAAK